LKIQGVEAKKDYKASREQDRKSRKKPKSQKLGYPVCQTGLSDFFRTDSVQLGFEI
jgi:hypothetical protein